MRVARSSGQQKCLCIALRLYRISKGYYTVNETEKEGGIRLLYEKGRDPRVALGVLP